MVAVSRFWPFKGGVPLWFLFLCLVLPPVISVSCSLVVTYWKMMGPLALLYIMVSCAFVTFLCCFLGQARYLIVSIPDHCLLSYFSSINVPF